MHFGIVANKKADEHRVILAPYEVEELVSRGHQVTIEKGVGERARFTDNDYENGGAKIAYSKDEAWMRPDLIIRICPPSIDELELMREGQIFAGYVEMPFIPQSTRKAYSEKKITLLALEEMTDDGGAWPILAPLSMICGMMLPQVAARYLETSEGGRGKLIMGVPGVAPCNISIIGAGLLGTTATQIFQLMGARVTVLDRDLRKLEMLSRNTVGFLTTLSANPGNISRICRGSDVLILAIHSETGVCDKIITREHLKTMSPRALIIDAAITQGGAAESSRPTTVSDPTYIIDDIIHYCVPSITSTVARTASRAVSTAVLPYLQLFAENTIEQALASFREFDTGLICIEGSMRRNYQQF